MKTVVLSAGHSTSDPGAVRGTTKESFLTMEIVKYATEIIQKHDVVCLNVPDHLSLLDTIKYINNLNRDIDACVEVHINAGGGQGVEAWCYYDYATRKRSKQSELLSQFLVEAVCVETNMAKRGVFDESIIKYGRLGFVHDTKPIASLVECGFIDNEYDLKMLLTESGRFTIAKGVARGLLGYIGIQWNPDLANKDLGNSQTNEELRKEISELRKRLQNIDNEYKVKLEVINGEIKARRDRARAELQKVMEIV